jgi:hypothetical protein
MPFRHYESSAVVPAQTEQVFALVDDHMSLSAHMGKPSWKMSWSHMEIILDEHREKSVGSRIRLDGRILGIRLAIEEVVTEHNPPHRKLSVGSPRLLVIGHYCMGFEITPQFHCSAYSLTMRCRMLRQRAGSATCLAGITPDGAHSR